MPIYRATGNIFEIGPPRAEVIAVWLRGGYNFRATTWANFVQAHGDALPENGDWLAVYPTNPRAHVPVYERFRQKPWGVTQDTLVPLVEPIQQLNYIYFFSNPEDRLGCVTLVEVGDRTRDCLNSAAEHGARSVALIHIPTVEFHDLPLNADDHRAAMEMYNAAFHWLGPNADNDFRVCLVDLNDAFEEIPGLAACPPGEA